MLDSQALRLIAWLANSLVAAEYLIDEASRIRHTRILSLLTISPWTAPQLFRRLYQLQESQPDATRGLLSSCVSGHAVAEDVTAHADINLTRNMRAGHQG
jgi:hypothetical protein